MDESKDKEKELTLEEMFARLEEITKKLESPQTTLEESFTLYKEGSMLLKAAQGRISLVEKQVKEIADDGSMTDFE